MLRLFTLLLLLNVHVAGHAAQGVEHITVALPGGDAVPVSYFRGGPDRILWLPAEYGLREAHPGVAAALAAEGFDVWLADLHTAWFLIPGRSSYTDVDPGAIAALIESARPEKGRLYVLTAGRGAPLALMGMRRWQLDNPNASPLGGALLLHPNFAAENPEPGKPTRYLPIAGASNLPVYILQPLNSAKRWHMQELVKRLRRGGSTVYVQVLRDVADGFHVRADAGAAERAARERLPETIRRAAEALDRHNNMARAPTGELTGQEGWRLGALATGLQPFPGEPRAPATAFADLDGNRVSLNAFGGKVVLLNFWATWCPPCVEEIPSLGRLQERVGRDRLAVVGVDVGEPAVKVREFLEKVPAAYPVLLDPDGSAAAQWSLSAFPTTFLIDRQGRIRYSYFGALEWDDDEVVRLIESLP